MADAQQSSARRAPLAWAMPALLAAAVVLAAGAAALVLEARALERITARQEQIGYTLLRMRYAFEAMLDTETGQRGYLITGDESYLEPYFRGRAEYEVWHADVRKLLAGQGDFPQQWEQVHGLFMRKLAVMEASIGFRRAGRIAEAVGVVVEGTGKTTMDQIRQIVIGLNARIRDEGLRNIERTRAAVRYLRNLLLGLGVLTAALVGFSVWTLRRALAEVGKLNTRLAHEASHDELTGLPNRRYFDDWLEHSVARCERDGGNLALLYLDLDGFKQVNDTQGHDKGDLLLQAVAYAIRQHVRRSDFPARLAGDEFALVVTNSTEKANLSILAERLLRSLRSLVPADVDASGVSVSIGIARYPQDGATPEQLLAAADAAMYEVKRSGKGSYAFASEGVSRFG